jgi:hypothetical protein
VLSDGPDPAADRVGYAEAQILPLRQLALHSGSLRVAVDALDAAYAHEFAADGSSSSRRATDRAEAALDALCPGAAP